MLMARVHLQVLCSDRMYRKAEALYKLKTKDDESEQHRGSNT